MKQTLLKQTAVNIAFVVAAVLVAAFTAHGATPTEDLLLKAGFQSKVAKTVSQRQQLEKLPKEKVFAVTQNGKAFYAYPDAQRNQLFVGDEGQYQTYLDELALAGSSTDEILNADYVGSDRVKLPDFSEWERFDETTNN
jgi:hypothetical protein